MSSQQHEQTPKQGRVRVFTPIAVGIGLVLLYGLLSIYFLRPLVSHFATATPAGGFSSDQCQTVWFFWWTKTALAHPNLSLFWTDAVYFPGGTGLGYHLCLFTNLLALGLASVLGLSINAPALFNLMVILSFVLTGVGSYLLIRHVVGKRVPALLGSVLVTFAPYRLWHLDHLNLLSTQWVLFAITCALLYFRRPRVGYLAGAVLFMGVAFYVSLTNVMIAVLFLIAYVLVFFKRLWQHPQRRQLIIGAGIGILLAIGIALPGLLQLEHADAAWQIGWRDTVQHSPDVLRFVLPAPGQRSTGPGEPFLGWVLIGLSLAAVTIFRTKDSLRWGLLALIFLIMSLGPSLIVAGHPYLSGWMPYRFLFDAVPYLNLARTPTRLIVAAEWACGILVAFAIDGWVMAIRGAVARRWRTIVTGLTYAAALVTIGLEYGSHPIPLLPMSVPPVYSEVAADESIHVICDLPIRPKLQINNWYMYWQTFHGRKAVNGYLTHHSVHADTLVQQIASWEGFDAANQAVLRNVGVDAVVYHAPGQPEQVIRLNAGSDESEGQSTP